MTSPVYPVQDFLRGWLAEVSEKALAHEEEAEALRAQATEVALTLDAHFPLMSEAAYPEDAERYDRETEGFDADGCEP